MRSYLTRGVFRRIITNRPIAHTYRPRLPVRWARNDLFTSHWTQQRRTFWGFLSNQSDDEYFTPEYERYMAPGMQIMEDLAEAIQQKTRPPDCKTVGEAFLNFIVCLKPRTRDRRTSGPLLYDSPVPRLNEYFARHLLQTFDYLQDKHKDGLGWEKMGLNEKVFIDALGILSSVDVDSESSAVVAELSSKIFDTVTKHVSEGKIQTEVDPRQWNALETYIHVLVATGQSQRALELLDQSTYNQDIRKEMTLIHIIRGLAVEGKEEQASKLAESRVSDPDVIKELLLLLLSTTPTKHKYVTMRLSTHFKDYIINTSNVFDYMLLFFAIKHEEFDWGRQWYQLCTERICRRANLRWSGILMWLTANNKSTEEIEKTVMEIRRREVRGESPGNGPSIVAINKLIAYANSKNNPFAAERYLEMGRNWGLVPNAETYLYRMEVRVQTGDLEGAISCYKELEVQEDIEDDRDLPGLNAFLGALCSAGSAEYDLIISILDKLLTRRNSLFPDTVAILVRFFIGRGELGEATDLLKRVRLEVFTKRQRELVRKALFGLATMPELKTLHAWQAYELLIKAFPELSVDDRTKIMNSFFMREQSDMACLVFGHMRQSQHKAKRPTNDTYTQCFEGLCRYPDEGSLQLVHNMLRLDTYVDPSTRLRNGLMLAYMNSESPQRSLEYWDEILNSQEGPTYNSILIVLLACQKAMGGSLVARVIMRRLRSLEVDVTPEIYAAYLGALCHHGELALTFDLVQRMEADVGLSPNVLTLGTIFNCMEHPRGKADIKLWASQNYPDIWTELQKAPRTEPDDYGVQNYQIMSIPRA